MTTTTNARKNEGPTPLEWFLSELARVEGCETTKRKVRTLLGRMAGQQLYLSKSVLQHRERVRAAVVLLDSGVSATKTRADVASRFKVTARTAERIVTKALNERASALRARNGRA